MTDDETVVVTLEGLVRRPDAGTAGFAPAPRRDVRCLLGTPERPVLLRVVGGRVASVSTAPGPLPDYQFAFLAPADTWLEFWRPLPRPGFHDIFALTKGGHATLTGDLQPLMAHLAFFKDLLAAPRGQARDAA